MRAFVTGATGFIGGYVARALIAHGDDVTALVRNPDRGADLVASGVRLAPGDITDPSTLGAIRGHDAVFHLAAWYAIGVADRTRMLSSNVDGTQNVLRAAIDAGISRIVYCSTVAALGMRPAGDIAREDTARPDAFGSVYEETKTRAHAVAQDFAAAGAPVVTVMPGAVYGPGDTSMIGTLLRLYSKRLLIACPFLGTGFSFVPVADLADGIVAAHDKGLAGHDYILGGDNLTLREAFSVLAPLTGIHAPRVEIPAPLLHVARPFGSLAGRLLHAGPKIVTEGLASMGGSWMASSEKAERELGYTYRGLADAMPETVEWFKEN